MKSLLALSALLASIVYNVHCSKILVAVPMPSHSHYTIAFRLAEELANRGHEVTCISPYPRKTPIKNLKDVPIVDIIDMMEVFKKDLLKMDKKGAIGNLLTVFEIGNRVTDYALKHKNVQQLLQSKEQFDVVIIEHFLNEAFVGLGHHFNAPVILASPLSTAFSNYMVGNPAPSSYIPNLVGSFQHPMSFLDRIVNFIMTNLHELGREFLLLRPQRELFQTHFKANGVQLDDLLYNVSLIFANSHASVQDPVPLVPNIIEIGGYHLSPVKPLPAELAAFLDAAKEGVILFSMGSNLKSKDLKPEVRAALLKAFGGIKQKVLWKFEEALPEAPANVKVMKWLPQNDVLAHKNIRAFITHGGLLSTIETVYHGVPIVGIPVFGDQKGNTAMAVRKGYGVGLDLETLTEEKLTGALNEILNNPKYRNNVKERSRLMHDRPLTPIDTAVYWIEYVIRHKGAPHLRTGAVDLAWYQLHMVDIIVVLTLITILLFALFYYMFKHILRLLCCRSKSSDTANKQTKTKVKKQ